MARKNSFLCNPDASASDGAELPELRALTGLRALAAFAVLLFHLRWYSIDILGPGAAPIVALLNAGYLGVDLFFLLSGFILSYRYGTSVRSFVSRSYLRFLWARLARIYPIHLVTLLLMLLYVGVAVAADLPLPDPQSYSYDADDFLQQLLLIASWSVPVTLSWNMPAWSISVEWAAYLAFPALYALTGRMPARWSSLALMLLAYAALLTWFAASHPYSNTAAYGLLRLFGCFLVGCMLQRLHAVGAGREAPWHAIVPMALLALPTVAMIIDMMGGQSFAVAPIFLSVVIYGLAMDESRGLGHWLAKPLAVYWGQVSYSVYMVQWIVLAAGSTLIRTLGLRPMSPAVATLTLVLLLGFVLLLATLLYRLIEVPCRQRMRRWYAESPSTGKLMEANAVD